MWILLTAAWAGQIVVDAKVPAAVMVDGEMVAQVWQKAAVRVDVDDGPHQITVVVGGNPSRFDVTVGPEAPVVVIAGRSGVTLGAAEGATAPDSGAPAQPVGVPGEVLFRVAGKARLMVQVGRQRVVVGPGEGVALALGVGEHALSVRSSDGTAVYARGVLSVGAGEGPYIVQLTEGGLPETSGEGLAFSPDRT